MFFLTKKYYTVQIYLLLDIPHKRLVTLFGYLETLIFGLYFMDPNFEGKKLCVLYFVA
jgi:hypothetical protein